MNEKRYETLCEFINQAHATSVQAIKADALTISPEHFPNVKYIIVDPSCSGSGMDRFEIRSSDEENLQGRLRKLHSLQSMILGHALRNFPNVKKVIYSTCSIYQEENESVVDEVLRKVGDSFTLVNLKKKLKNEWHSFASSEYGFNGEKCLYALPEADLCKGFFIAMFKRKSKEETEAVDQIFKSEELDATEKIVENHETSLKSSKFCHDNTHKKDETEPDDVCNEYSKSKKRKKASKKRETLNEEYQVTSVESVEKEVDESSEIPVKKMKKEKKKKISCYSKAEE